MELDEDLALPVPAGMDPLTHRISVARLQHVSNLAWCLGSWLPHLVSLSVFLIRLVRICRRFCRWHEYGMQYCSDHQFSFGGDAVMMSSDVCGPSVSRILQSPNLPPSFCAGAQQKRARRRGRWRDASFPTGAHSEAVRRRSLRRWRVRLRRRRHGERDDLRTTGCKHGARGGESPEG